MILLMLVLDGSYGEGGGQIVRTSLSLAALTGKTVRLENIRAGRSQPGLRPQHLTAVRALAQITRATLTGDNIGSTHLTYSPQGIFPGNYIFDVAEKIGSAGSVCLIAQTLLPVLFFSQTPSTLVIKGGTHVPWSPPAHYLSTVFLPALKEMGPAANLEIRQWGFYPRGGGEIQIHLNPVRQLNALEWDKPPEVTDFQGLSAAANLPSHVARRQSSVLAGPPEMAPAHPGSKPSQSGARQLCFSLGATRRFFSLRSKRQTRGTGGGRGSPSPEKVFGFQGRGGLSLGRSNRPVCRSGKRVFHF